MFFLGGLTWSAGANIFLAYYHYCNKGVYPFSTECKDSDLQNLAELDEGSINFIKYTRKYAKEHSKLALSLSLSLPLSSPPPLLLSSLPLLCADGRSQS